MLHPLYDRFFFGYNIYERQEGHLQLRHLGTIIAEISW